MRVLLIVALIAAASATLPTTVVTTGTSKASTTSTVNAESTEYTPTEATTTTTLKSTTAAATTKASTKSKSAVTLTSKAASNTTTTKSNSTTSTSTVAPNTTESTTNNYWTMLGVPECMRTCVTPLGPAWDAVMTLNNTVEKLYSLCGNWTAVNTCTLKTKAKGCFPRPMLIKGYNALTSGVKMTCLNKKPLWKVHETCLKKNNTLDTVLQACDAKCGYRGNMTAFQSKMPTVSKGQDQGDFSSFVAQLGNLCDSMACALPCVRDQLNKACVTTGNLAMASYVPPIEELSSFLKFGPLKLRQKVKKVVPASCSALLEDAYLRKLKLGLKL